MRIEFASFDWVSVLAVAGIIAALIAMRRRAPAPYLFWWRAVTLLLLLLVALQPLAVRRSGARHPLVAVAVDTSPSMFIAGRVAPAKAFLGRWQNALRKAWDVRLYQFDSGSNAIKDVEAIRARPAQTPTDLQRSLWEIKREAGEALAGIVVISDFNHTASPLAEQWIAELNVPVIAVTAGEGNTVKDIAVDALSAGDFAFKNVPFSVSAHYSAQGFSGATVTVNLKDAKTGAVLACRQVTVAHDREEAAVDLQFTPVQSGRCNYVVQAVPLAGEVTAANNRRDFSLDVIRDKLRVLFICGKPGPEYAFLRHRLKNDPLVELVSFVTLRAPQNIALAPENDLSLIPFPVHTLFTRDLFDFDALIFDDFAFGKFGFMPEYLKNIHDWVTDKGGGLVMIAGKDSFGSSGWWNTPVADVLPVTFDGSQGYHSDGLFTAAVENKSHFITTVSDDRVQNDMLWKKAAALDGCQIMAARPGAQTLLRNPVNGAVVLAAWDRGKGRVVIFGTNTTWRWALESDSPELYNRIWKNIVRYVTKSADAKPLRLALERNEYAAGQEYTLRARASERVAGSMLGVTVTDPSGRRTVLPAVRDSEKEWRCSGVFSMAGSYTFEAELSGHHAPSVHETAMIKVVPALHNEETLLGCNETMARAMAEGSGGMYCSDSTFTLARAGERLKKQEEKAVEEKNPLWTSPLLLALCIASLAGEWYVRRRTGRR